MSIFDAFDPANFGVKPTVPADQETEGQPFGYSSDAGFRNRQNAKARAFLSRSPDTTIIQNPRAFTMDNEADYTPTQRGAIRSNALSAATDADSGLDPNGHQGGLYGEVGGKSYWMAPSTRVTGSKADAYLARLKAEQDAAEQQRLTKRSESMQDQDLARKRTAEDRTAQAADEDRQFQLGERQHQVVSRDLGEMDQRSLQPLRMEAQRGQLEQQVADASPEHRQNQEMLQYLQPLLQSKNPKARAFAAKAAAQLMPGASQLPGLGDAMTADLSPTGSEPAFTAVNDASVAPFIQQARAMSRKLKDTRSIGDDSLGGLASNLIPGMLPYKLLSGRGVTSGSADPIAGLVEQAVQAAKRVNPDADEAQLRSIIANQIAGADAGDPTAVSGNIRKAAGL